MNNKILIVSANYYKEISNNLELGATNTLRENGYDYDKLKNSLSTEIDFAGDLNSSSEMKLHLATVLIKKVLSKLEI